MVKPRHFKHVWLSEIMADVSLGFDVRGLMGAIAETVMRPDGMNVWAGQRYLAETCGTSQPTISRLIRQAISAGYLVVEDRADDRGIVRPHYTPLIPIADSDVNHNRSGSESTGDPDPVQNPFESNPVENPMASSEAGPKGPTAIDAEQALIMIAMLGDSVTAEDVASLWPTKITPEAGNIIRDSVSSHLWFFGHPGLADAVEIPDAGEFAFAVALALECASARLDMSLTAAQVRMIADEIRNDLDLSRPTSMIPAPDGSAAAVWNAPPTSVTDPVKFIVGSIRSAIQQEGAISCG